MATSTIKTSTSQRKYMTRSVSLTSGQRTSFTFDPELPSGANILGVFLNNSPNADWLMYKFIVSSDNKVTAYVHNEYSGSISGTLAITVRYEA